MASMITTRRSSLRGAVTASGARAMGPGTPTSTGPSVRPEKSRARKPLRRSVSATSSASMLSFSAAIVMIYSSM
jgi:hypothetical protein